MNEERTEIKIIVDDKTKMKFRLKKWYCIIMGFNYGLVGVITSLPLYLLIIVSVLFISIFFFCFMKEPLKFTKELIKSLMFLDNKD